MQKCLHFDTANSDLGYAGTTCPPVAVRIQSRHNQFPLQDGIGGRRVWGKQELAAGLGSAGKRAVPDAGELKLQREAGQRGPGFRAVQRTPLERGSNVMGTMLEGDPDSLGEGGTLPVSFHR